MVTEESNSQNSWIQFTFCSTCDSSKRVGFNFTEWIKQLHLASMKADDEKRGAVPKLESYTCKKCESETAIKVTFVW